MMDTMIDMPEEDSPDLTSDEIAGAIEAPDADIILDTLSVKTCPTCTSKLTITKHQLRKRAPLFYARVLFVCSQGHQGSVLFRASFLGGSQ